MSSERYELAQDDLEVALEEIRDTVERATSQSGGRKKGTLNPEDKRQLVTRYDHLRSLCIAIHLPAVFWRKVRGFS